jgi:hypothetical protein
VDESRGDIPGKFCGVVTLGRGFETVWRPPELGEREYLRAGETTDNGAIQTLKKNTKAG